ncbi:hypothetical protein BT93_H2359 [Corymbia citriodora subsp. variegata]|nr:hypothetical protein BT93_H2359 [Corymbia citriodora subsp. variegata]
MVPFRPPTKNEEKKREEKEAGSCPFMLMCGVAISSTSDVGMEECGACFSKLTRTYSLDQKVSPPTCNWGRSPPRYLFRTRSGRLSSVIWAFTKDFLHGKEEGKLDINTVTCKNREKGKRKNLNFLSIHSGLGVPERDHVPDGFSSSPRVTKAA